MRIQVLYEDNHVIAVFKPAGVLMQGDASGKESLLDTLRAFLKERDKKPGKVFLGLLHRLDRPVSGIVLFAKTSKGAARLSEQFRNRTIQKTYHAIVEGRVNPPAGILKNYLCKNSAKKIALVSDTPLVGYSEAILSYKTILSADDYSLMTVSLKTGRFHQIRAQLAHIGHPIVGDTKYGFNEKISNGAIALCSTGLEFVTATGGETKKLSVSYPESWEKYLS